MTKKLVRKMQLEPVTLSNLVVRFIPVLTGSQGIDMHDPECEVGCHFYLWVANGQWTFGPSGPRVDYYDKVTIQGDNLVDKDGKIIECANKKEAIEMMRNSL